MAFHLLVVLQIMLPLWPIKASQAQLCQYTCGNVSIQYPFGIGDKDCYFDRGYEITCSNSSGSPKPILTRIGLEIYDIHLSSASSIASVSVKSPVISLNTSSYRSAGPKLSGSPYSISSTWNNFSAIGCHNSTTIDLLKSSLMTDDCLNRTCDPNKHQGCFDFHCSFPPGHSFADSNTSTLISLLQNKCESAFIVDNLWLDLNYTTDALKDLKYVPAALEWGQIKGTCAEFLFSDKTSCNVDNYCVVQSSGSGHYCLCDRQFTDINVQDICKLKQLSDCNLQPLCTGTLICNTSSGYDCSQCPQGYLGVREGRCDIYYSSRDKDDSDSRVKLLIITGCSSGFGFLLLLIAAWQLYKFINRRKEMKKKQKFFKRNGGLLLQQHMSSSEGKLEKTKLFTSKELEKATDNYNANRILGQGGQGTVFKGMLDEGRIVAIKRSKIIDETKLEEFINEVVILSRINHRNVVQLLGCCLETEVPLLVYEFIPNGTLFQYIHGENEEFPITWELRLGIATEVAHALSYLHSSASIPIYHRDIKSTNILLDDKYRAKVSDFGTSRSVTIEQTHLTTQVHGTFGYVDPEYFRSSQFTEKSDVYSFGVVLAELLTGQKPIRSTNTEEDKSLAVYFLRAMKENRLFEILDGRVVKEGEKEEILIVAHLTRRCLNLSGKKRPTMREVATELARIKASNEASILQQNCEEIDCTDGGITSCFESNSSFTGSVIDSATFSMEPIDPLISNRWH